MSSEPVIRVSKLSKSFPIYARPTDRLKQFILPRLQRMFGLATKQYYKTFTALSEVSFEIHKGETVGIIGRNGAGKSTLLQILCGTLSPSSGEVEVKGRVAALLELGAGFNGEYTGRENVYMNARILGLTDDEIDARFADIVAFADIGEHLEQPVRTYSSGMFVRLAFAVIAHVDAGILVIDEALAVGDAGFASKCLRYLRTFQQSGVVLFVTHDTGITRSLCSKSLWLQSGKVVSSGNVKDVCDAYEADIRKDLFKSEQAITISNVRALDKQPPVISGQINNERISLFACNLSVCDSPTVYFSGGERTSICFNFLSIATVNRLIIGFVVRDKRGQALFGENNLGWQLNVQHAVPLLSNARVEGEFIFQMPFLVAGRYSVTFAISDGTQDEHEVLAWFPDATTFYSTSLKLTTGLVGIPIEKFSIKQTQLEN